MSEEQRPELDDTSPMPFGKYKGDRMEDVPAKYLHYLWTTGMKDARQQAVSPVARYIKRNLSALAQEYTDGIW